MTALSDRVEAASGPDRELDAAVFRAIGAPVPEQFFNQSIALEYDAQEQAYFAVVSDDMRVKYTPPAYTTSLDAAMMLLPDNAAWVMASHMMAANVFGYRDGSEYFDATARYAATPALALTAACLRARGL